MSIFILNSYHIKHLLAHKTKADSRLIRFDDFALIRRQKINYGNFEKQLFSLGVCLTYLTLDGEWHFIWMWLTCRMKERAIWYLFIFGFVFRYCNYVLRKWGILVLFFKVEFGTAASRLSKFYRLISGQWKGHPWTPDTSQLRFMNLKKRTEIGKVTIISVFQVSRVHLQLIAHLCVTIWKFSEKREPFDHD